MCSCCKFRSRKYNLYQDVAEASRGRRAANINRSLHVGLSQTSIGPSSFSKVLCSIHTPPPSARHEAAMSEFAASQQSAR